MKALLTIVSASALLMGTFGVAEAASMNQKGGQGKAPEKVSQEMGKQEKGNAYGEGQGMMQGNGPEKVSHEMGKQGKANAYGEGQGMMQGKHKGMEESSGMMDSGKGKGKTK